MTRYLGEVSGSDVRYRIDQTSTVGEYGADCDPDMDEPINRDKWAAGTSSMNGDSNGDGLPEP